MKTAIEFRDASVVVSGGHVLVDCISLALDEGTTTAILGRSGSGKTTLLKTVNRMVALSDGAVLVNGNDNRDEDLIALRRGIGYVIQETGLFPHFSVGRNVGLLLEVAGRPLDERSHRARELLNAVGLDPSIHFDRFPYQLSGGQRQRVGLARALAAEPPILLMDEPFGALDPLTRAEMQDLLLALMKHRSRTVLLVTHDLDEALYLADRIVLLDHGKLTADLTPEDFLRSDIESVQSYVSAFHRGARGAHTEARSGELR